MYFITLQSIATCLLIFRVDRANLNTIYIVNYLNMHVRFSDGKHPILIIHFSHNTHSFISHFLYFIFFVVKFPNAINCQLSDLNYTHTPTLTHSLSLFLSLFLLLDFSSQSKREPGFSQTSVHTFHIASFCHSKTKSNDPISVPTQTHK